jgi:hypothetical protein
LITKDVETDATVGVNVRVIDSRRKVHLLESTLVRTLSTMGSAYLWRFEWVVCGEMNGEEKDASGVWTISLGTNVLATMPKSNRLMRNNVPEGQGNVPVP